MGGSSLPPPDWGGSAVDVDAYLERLHYQGPLEVSVDTLWHLHRAHVRAIPFENVDVLLDRPPALAVQELQDKLVYRRRGGYCYEHNLLLAAVLERLGFRITGLMARIRMGSDKIRMRSHALLRVDVQGQSWLADVGFGAEGTFTPLRLDRLGPTEGPTGEWGHRLCRWPGGVVVRQSRHPDDWFDLYSFTMAPHYPVDYAPVNHYMATHPHSPFRSRLVVGRTTPQRRWQLTGPNLLTAAPDGTRTTREIEPAELDTTLREIFGLELDATDLARLDGAEPCQVAA